MSDGNNWCRGLRAIGVDSRRPDCHRVAEKLLLADQKLAQYAAKESPPVPKNESMLALPSMRCRVSSISAKTVITSAFLKGIIAAFDAPAKPANKIVHNRLIPGASSKPTQSRV
ncbi:MAG: hypothetical protein OXU96_07670 [Gammaproteobacteria bacterium]|nr:hypothetical protein [Gammaproteobacteria bacterium]